MEKLIPCKKCQIKHPASTQEMKIYSVLAECDDELFNEGATEPFMYGICNVQNVFFDRTCFNCKNKFVKHGVVKVRNKKLGFCVPCLSLFGISFKLNTYTDYDNGSTCSGGAYLTEILNLRYNQKNVKAVLILLNHKVLPNDLVRMLKPFLY